MTCPLHPDKHRYVTHAQANDAARGIRRKTRVFFRAYECVSCGGYHLTTKGRSSR